MEKAWLQNAGNNQGLLFSDGEAVPLPRAVRCFAAHDLAAPACTETPRWALVATGPPWPNPFAPAALTRGMPKADAIHAVCAFLNRAERQP